MEYTRNENGTELTVCLEGRLDTVTAPRFEEELNAALEGVETLILDLEKLDYISSAGLRVLLRAEKLMETRGGMKLVRVSEPIMDIFEVTCFSEILFVEREA